MVFLWATFAVVLAPVAPTMVIILFAMAGFGSLVLHILCSAKAEFKYYPINKYIYAFAGIYLVSVFTSVDIKGSLYGGMLTVLFIMFYVVVVNAVKKKIQFKALIFMMVSVGIFLWVLSVHEPEQVRRGMG